MDDTKLLSEIVQEAGEIGLKYFKRDPEVWIKGKNSPVSEADLAIDRFLKEKLLEARPNYGWLSEESEDDEARRSANRIFVVDPIDGTRGFLKETENWMVSVAIVENGRPVSGVLFGPVMERLYVATKGEGATLNGSRLSSINNEQSPGGFAMPSKLTEHLEKPLGRQPQLARYVHSLAYRMALVADGEFEGVIAKPYPHDWDIAAVDLILEEVDASLLDVNGKAPTYNNSSTRHGWLIASGKTLFTPMQEAVIQAINSHKD